jgi:flagellar protein FliS
MNASQATSTYQTANLESQVAAASANTLITLLLDGALVRIARAKGHVERGEKQFQGEVIGKVIDIVASLDSYLDHEKGGEVSKNLESLYDYIVRQLFQANLKSDIGPLEESERLLGEIRAGWTEMDKQQRDA